MQTHAMLTHSFKGKNSLHTGARGYHAHDSSNGAAVVRTDGSGGGTYFYLSIYLQTCALTSCVYVL
jgi:hypothetical protein